MRYSPHPVLFPRIAAKTPAMRSSVLPARCLDPLNGGGRTCVPWNNPILLIARADVLNGFRAVRDPETIGIFSANSRNLASLSTRASRALLRSVRSSEKIMSANGAIVLSPGPHFHRLQSTRSIWAGGKLLIIFSMAPRRHRWWIFLSCVPDIWKFRSVCDPRRTGLQVKVPIQR